MWGHGGPTFGGESRADEKPGPRDRPVVTFVIEMVVQPSPAHPADEKVVPLKTSDDAIVRGLVSGELWAANALHDRYAVRVERLLRRTLGYERHTEIEDLVHEVFLQALTSASTLRDSVALLGWLQTITVRVAFRTMRRRRARSWLHFYSPEELPEVASEEASPEVRRACASFYRVVDKLPATEQLVFTLRYVEGMEVAHLAKACEMSLSTAKRRLAKAEERFSKMAGREPDLSPWVEEGGRWPA